VISKKVERRRHPVRRDEFGLFAREDIKPGEVVWWVGIDDPPQVEMTWKEIEAMPEDEREFFKTYSYQTGRDRFLGPACREDLEIEQGWAHNHSCDPNCWIDTDFSVVARRPITVDEELTLDYGTIWSKDICIADCKCGSPKCRGKIGGRDYQKLVNIYDHRVMSYMLED
jgi:SET domain-containing protein